MYELVAATNRDLEALVKEGLFRKDLYYRLKVMVVEMPPLRKSGEDILLLSNLFIQQNNKDYNKNIKGLSEEAKKMMIQYNWPGNVRELKNVIERAMILTDQEYITHTQLPFELKEPEEDDRWNVLPESLDLNAKVSLEHMEMHHISNVLRKLGME